MKTSKKIALFFLFFVCNSVLMAQQTSVFKLPFPRQYKTLDTIIDSLALQDHKVAIRRLKKLELQARETNDKLAVLNYKRSEIRYRFIRTINNEKRSELNQLIADTEQLIATINEEQYPEIAALLHFQIGNSLDYQKYNYKEQFTHYLKAYDLFKNIPLEQFPYRHYSQYAIALAYYQFGEYQKAITLAEEVEALYLKNDFNSILSVNLIGLCYLELKKYDQAIASFKWILKNNKYALNPTAWKGIALCSLGRIYYSQGNNAKAIFYLTQGLPILKQEAILVNLANGSLLLAKIYIVQKNSIAAKKYLNIVTELRDEIKSTPFVFEINKLLSDYYQLEGNYKLSLSYLQLANVYKDSIAVSENINKMHAAEMNFAKQKQRLLLNQIEQKIIHQRIILIFLSLFTLLLFITLRIFFDRSKLRLKMEQQELVDKNEKIASELDLANVRLEQYMQSRLHKDPKNQNTDDQENLVSKLVNESTLHTKEDWNEFRTLFEQAHPRYLQRVKEKLPKISPAELRLTAIHKLNLNTNEMALILNISPDAVRKSKKRLTLKIAENLHQSFDEFISSLL
ncbi:tetratricopeptide repeat protein [Winogradskyella sp.]|nr:tetratricopeptide repeat protein [Winogradskyella sp.]